MSLDAYSNDKHEDFPIGMKFALNDVRYSIYRVDDISNKITCVSKMYGFTYIELSKLKTLIRDGIATAI